MVVSSTTCASGSSQIDHVILEITSLGAPEICCHQSGASRDFDTSRITSRDHRGVPGPLAVRRRAASHSSWFKIPSKASDQVHVALGGSFSKDRLDRQKAHGERGFYRRGARSALTSRVVRIRRAGCSRDRRLAGDSGIDHQLLGSGRRRFTIHKVWPAAEKGYPREGPVDLGCS